MSFIGCQVDLNFFISIPYCVILAYRQPENANPLNRTCIIMPNRHTSLMTDLELKFFKALGSRVSQLRKDQGMTQTELAEPLGITQPMMASYEIGRRRIPASLLPALAHELRVSVGELLGEPQKNSKPGPVPKLQKQLEAVSDLPKQQQQFVSQFLDTVLNQAAAS